jgi:predicted nicotinamide N-methyase
LNAGPAEHFIRTHTQPGRTALVPELTLHLATEITPIWQATEAWLLEANIAPPFWAFAWAGGQAAARHVLDHPSLAAGKRVLDFAAGGGIAGLAAARAGAALVEANDIDPLALAAIGLNAAANDLPVTALAGDIIGSACRWDLILAADVCYEANMTSHVLPWLRGMASQAEVWIADPGRAYLPGQGLERMAEYDVPTTKELEDQTQRRTVLYRLSP